MEDLWESYHETDLESFFVINRIRRVRDAGRYCTTAA